MSQFKCYEKVFLSSRRSLLSIAQLKIMWLPCLDFVLYSVSILFSFIIFWLVKCQTNLHEILPFCFLLEAMLKNLMPVKFCALTAAPVSHWKAGGNFAPSRMNGESPFCLSEKLMVLPLCSIIKFRKNIPEFVKGGWVWKLWHSCRITRC